MVEATEIPIYFINYFSSFILALHNSSFSMGGKVVEIPGQKYDAKVTFGVTMQNSGFGLSLRFMKGIQ